MSRLIRMGKRRETHSSENRFDPHCEPEGIEESFVRFIVVPGRHYLLTPVSSTSIERTDNK